jgi:ferredoxin
MKISVNQDVCAGYGTCVEIAPGLFALDEWGYAIATLEGEVPDGQQELARDAALQCPMNAIALEDERDRAGG